MKSTTGAYGDFPDYYYERGNQFGSFLLGRSQRMSPATRKEVEALEGGSMVIHVPEARHTKALKDAPKTAHGQLMDFVGTKIRREDDRFVRSSLARARGVQVPPSGRDPNAQLADFILRHLTAADARVVLQRLRAVVEQAERKGRRRRKKRRPRSKRGTRQLQSPQGRTGQRSPPPGMELGDAPSVASGFRRSKEPPALPSALCSAATSTAFSMPRSWREHSDPHD